ncbi:germin-like protein 5-1 [Selaginella moellendorffii]|uniref:germin-like protein 5-1 n=1 Tax=Selaginella moellendorffii TaxID=88036 RepID=UPI000D1C45F1|nr:germin-like protein 5-1 [Selaginella moellendorffii]|eukprot:XP_024540067.1 germin-like protein 5-1 [Selaginella moellendorffii]
MALLSLVLSLLAATAILAADPDPVQDFCVADLDSSTSVNGAACLTTASAREDNFTSTVLRNVQPVRTPGGFVASRVTVPQLPALNTQGLSVNRVDLGPGGVNTPHVHPRATELIYIMEGTVQAGFVDTTNKLFLKTLQKGDLFVVPRGLVHFQWNVGATPATIFATFNSQNPGVERLEITLFGSGIPDAVLAASFRLNQSVINELKHKFTP